MLAPGRVATCDLGDVAGLGSRRLQSFDELAGVDVEAGCELQQVVEVEVALAALDLAEEGPVDAAFGGEGFLAESERVAVSPDAFAELLRRRRDRWRHRRSPYVPSFGVQSTYVPTSGVLLECPPRAARPGREQPRRWAVEAGDVAAA